MDAIAKWGSVIIVLINTVFGIVSLVFLVIGCLAKYAADKIDEIAGSLIDVAKEKLPDQASEYIETDMCVEMNNNSIIKGEGGIQFAKFPKPRRILFHCQNLKVSEFVDGASAAFIASGCILLGVVIWAYCGTCCKSRWMLTIYAMILTTIILGEIAVVILVTTNRQLIDAAAKESLMTSLKSYQGGRGKNAQSRAWNAVMSLMHCCGVSGVSDFSSINGWQKQTSSTGGIIMAAPYICCKNQTSHCPDQRYNKTNQYNEGCYDVLWDLVESNKSFFIGTGVCFGLFELLIWFLTVWLIKQLGKKRNQVAPA